MFRSSRAVSATPEERASLHLPWDRGWRAGSSPFAARFRSLDAAAAAKVTTALRRLELGNFSNVKGVGAGVFEYRIDFGPGYRVYFGKDGETVVILLGGGTKKRQGRGRGRGGFLIRGQRSIRARVSDDFCDRRVRGI